MENQEQKITDLNELVVSLILQIEVLKNCLVENKLITSQEFLAQLNQLKEKRNK